MEPHNTSLPNISGHKMLHRSHSVQPDVMEFQGSSPYSSRRKSKNPGRSLTEIFTDKNKSRACSSDPSYALRRRTLTASSLMIPTPIIRNDEKKLLNRSFSEMSYSSGYDDENSFFGSQHDVNSLVGSRYDVNSLVGSQHDVISLVGSQHDVNSIVSSRHDDENYVGSRSVQDNLSFLDDLSKLKLEVKSRTPPPKEEFKCDQENKSDDIKPSYVKQIFKATLKLFFRLLVLLLIVTLLMLVLITYFAYEKAQCDLKRNMKIPLDKLSTHLSLSVIGQEIAVSAMLKSLNEFQMDKVNTHLIMWMVGWSGSGKTHTTSILKNVFSSMSKVVTVIPSLYPNSNEELLKQAVYGVYNQLDPCSLNIVVIDDWNEDNQPFRILEYLIHYFEDSSNEKNKKGKTVIILSGTHGSQYVNRDYLRLIISGKSRGSLQLNDFSSVSENVALIKEMSSRTKSLVFVPFLPMEVEQIRKCVTEELFRFGHSYRSSGHDEEKVIGQVIEQLNFIPSNRPLMAATGCKRVSPLLRLLLFKDIDTSL